MSVCLQIEGFRVGVSFQKDLTSFAHSLKQIRLMLLN